MTPRLRFGADGRFKLQPLERRLLVDGEPATLGARAFDLLLEMVARPGSLLTKRQLIDKVWPGVVVEEGNLAAQISALRKVLGGQIIDTIPGRGYRFAARVEAAGVAPAPMAAIGDTQPQRALALIRRCVARLPPMAANEGGPSRWAHQLALAALATDVARGGDVQAAVTALAKARALADPTCPPAMAFWLVDAEGFVARARGDMVAYLHWARLAVASEGARGSSQGVNLANLVDAELAAGNAAEAAANGITLVAALAGGRAERGMAYARVNLSAAMLALGQPDQAKPHLRAGWA